MLRAFYLPDHISCMWRLCSKTRRDGEGARHRSEDTRRAQNQLAKRSEQDKGGFSYYCACLSNANCSTWVESGTVPTVTLARAKRRRCKLSWTIQKQRSASSSGSDRHSRTTSTAAAAAAAATTTTTTTTWLATTAGLKLERLSGQDNWYVDVDMSRESLLDPHT